MPKRAGSSSSGESTVSSGPRMETSTSVCSSSGRVRGGNRGSSNAAAQYLSLVSSTRLAQSGLRLPMQPRSTTRIRNVTKTGNGTASKPLASTISWGSQCSSLARMASRPMLGKGFAASTNARVSGRSVITEIILGDSALSGTGRATNSYWSAHGAASG